MPPSRRSPASGEILGSSLEEAIQVEKYCEATRENLNRLPALFQALTGLRFHVAWASTSRQPWAEQDLPTHSSLCRCVAKRTPGTPNRCRRCALRHLALALASGHAGHHFTCPMGVRNYWLPIIVRQTTAGLAYVQTLDERMVAACMGKASRGQGDPSKGTYTRGRACRSTMPMNRADFKRAAKLVQLIFQHAESLTLADLRRADLARAQQALQVFDKVQARLRKELNGVLPTLHTTSPVPQRESRRERMVHAVLARIHQDYAQSLTLRKCASELRVNTAYLSYLFSRAVGLPFKTYLTEVRMEKARELLSDPARNISQVAAAVGYASENRFRSGFRKVTGLAPRVWRETMQIDASPEASPS